MKLPSYVALLMDCLEKAGYAAYAVGGAVRDALRGKEPSDWDLATSALPQDTLRVFSHLTTVPTGLAHGTVTVLSQGHPVEITTFRSDGEYRDHRHPLQVSFGCDLEEDLARRDFTVNAIAYSPRWGLVDPFGGREDLKEGILRAVGDPRKRFSEDALRMMRALRFASVLEYTVERDTELALREMLFQMDGVSAERIWKEWLLLLKGAGAQGVLQSYPDLLAFLFPSLWSKGEEIWGLSVDWQGASPLLRQGLCLCKPSLSFQENLLLAQKELKRLKCSNEQGKAVEDLLFYAENFPLEETERKLLWAKSPEDFSLWAQLHFLRRGEDPYSLSAWERCRREGGECLTLGALAVRGEELVALGYRGPDIARGLQGLLYAVASGELPNEKQALLLHLKAQRPSPEGESR